MTSNDILPPMTDDSFAIRRPNAAGSSPFKVLPSMNPLYKAKPNSPSSRKYLDVNDDDQSTSIANVSFAKDEKENLSPYARLLYDCHYDKRFEAEKNAGLRIGFYRLRGNIGEGNFARVKLGVHLLAKEKVAVKILDRTKLDAATQRLLLREISSIERFHHPNIIRLYEVIETPTQYYIITEYAPSGTLYARITNEGKFNETDAKYFFAQLTAAVDHMHSKGIVHRDIKCENVLFAKEHLIKLGDFGFSTYAEKDQFLTTFCGSPPYAAPELYRDEEYIGFYVDLWAMGVLLYFIVTGLMPFRAENLSKLKKSVISGNFSIPSSLSNECQDLIRGLLTQEPSERWSIEQVRSSSWLNKQHFPKELEPLPLNLTNFWTVSAEKDSSPSTPSSGKTPPIFPPRSSFEYAAHAKLEELGITPDVLKKARQNSQDKLLCNRDSINGTYRVILHRLQKQSDKLERDDQYEETIDEETASRYFRRSKSISVPSEDEKKSSTRYRRASHDMTRRKSHQNLDQSPIQTQMCTIL